ncbi:MAG: methylated-DNA--[protein]-cysteine S-methyltransferase [Mariprofundus sp.]|nr:methylated-DNA--[protein]-cysteine S-methyltransferase [Mariprofundus sp.]
MMYLFSSELGQIHYAWDGCCCTRLMLQQEPGAQDETLLLPHADPVSEWLEHYFNGDMQALPPLAPAATVFQQRMRLELLKIPVGEMRTYGEVAKALHTSPRAMGQALGANPLPVMIPCHRVVAADGLGGFAFGSLWKQQLLSLEAAASM